MSYDWGITNFHWIWLIRYLLSQSYFDIHQLIQSYSIFIQCLRTRESLIILKTYFLVTYNNNNSYNSSDDIHVNAFKLKLCFKFVQDQSSSNSVWIVKLISNVIWFRLNVSAIFSRSQYFSQKHKYCKFQIYLAPDDCKFYWHMCLINLINIWRLRSFLENPNNSIK